MRFHLDHTPPPFEHPLRHSQQVMLMGSCFSDHIGLRLQQHGFKAIVNPAGIAYDPFSLIEHLHGSKTGNEKFLLEIPGLFLSYLHHSSINDPDKKTLIEKLKTIQASIWQETAKSDFLMLTFGTAFVYEHRELKNIVANCHKQPGSLFNRRMLSVEEILSAYRVLLRHIHDLNPNLRIIFTVSPVRHLRDGLHENNLSKSTLLLAIDTICGEHDFCTYFPAYELVNDDLKDYRFYKEDLAHPNELAIDYVWDKFSRVFFNETTRRINALYFKLHLARQHRPMKGLKADQQALENHVSKLISEIRAIDPSLDPA